ncbi:MAG: alpha/beta hydrolase family protein [Anaerolineae bacterium]
MFRLDTHLTNQQAKRSYQFSLENMSVTEWEVWQQQLRAALTILLGISGRQPVYPAPPDLLHQHSRTHYSEEKYVLSIKGLPVPMYLLIPHSPPPYRAFIALHGHGIGVNQILGHYSDAAVAAQMSAHDENFAQRLAEAGYLVCAIEQQGFGERVTNQVSDAGYSCQHLAYHYIMYGQTLLGERVLEAMGALAYLLTREDVTTVGCIGHSAGATTALFLSALDTRLTFSVLSGYFCDYHHSILAMPHCVCNYIPHLYKCADISDIASLIAPRPLFLLHGENDPIFPIEGFLQALPKLKTAYAMSRSEHNLSYKLHHGAHQFVYQWVQQWLSDISR